MVARRQLTRAVLGAACGGALLLGGVAIAAPARAGQATSTLTVRETEYLLGLPRSATVRAGQRIVLRAVNSGAIAHALSISGPGLAEHSTANLAPGMKAALTVTLRKAGRYTLWCPIGGHRQLGMVTHLTVRS